MANTTEIKQEIERLKRLRDAAEREASWGGHSYDWQTVASYNEQIRKLESEVK